MTLEERSAARVAIMRDHAASIFEVIGNRPGYGLRGFIGEDAWAELFAGTSYDEDDFPLGWDERDAKI